MTRYRLRDGVRLTRGKDGRWLLRDSVLRRAMRLGDRDARVLRLLAEGRGRSFTDLVAKLGDAAEVRARLSALARLYVLAGPRAKLRLALAEEAAAFDAALAAAQADPAPDAAEIAIHFPSGRDPPKHSCVATGACCSASFLGPMSEPDRVRVSGLSLGKRAVVDAGSDALESVDFRGTILWGMRREAGTCVALGDDGLCDLHAEHGYDIKPIPCRQFPLRFHRTPWGLHVSLLLACEGYDRARDAADAWSTREPEVRGFLAEGAHVPASALPFEWSAGVPASVADTRALLDTLLGHLERDQTVASDADKQPELTESPLDPRAVLAEIIEVFESHSISRATALGEGETVATAAASGLATAGLVHALRASTPWFSDEGLLAHQAHLAQRAETLAARDEPADADRLTRFAEALGGLRQNLQLAPRGPFTLTSVARRHLLDVLANDLPAQIALGQLDAGLANLARRLRFIEAAACVLAAGADGREVTAAHTTLALKLAYRSEPDITALSSSWFALASAVGSAF